MPPRNIVMPQMDLWLHVARCPAHSRQLLEYLLLEHVGLCFN